MSNKRLRRLNILYWTPRIMAIIFIAFLGLFALDIFIPGQTVGYYIVGLFMHLIPNFVLAVILAIAWRHEKIGGLLFILISIGFTVFFKTYLSLPIFFLISFPVFVIGALFLINYYFKKRGGGKI